MRKITALLAVLLIAALAVCCFAGLKLRSAQQDAKKSGKAVTEMEDEAASIESEKAALEEEKAALEQEKAALSDEKTALAAERDALVAEREKLEEEKASLEAQKAELETQKAELEAEKAALTTERDALTAEKETLVSEKDALAEERATLEAEKETLEETEGEDADAVAKEAEIDTRIATLNERESELDAQIATLTENEAALTQEIETLRTAATEKDAEIARLTEESSAKDAEIEKLTEESAAKDAEIEKLTEESAAKDAEIETLTKESAEKDAEIAKLTEESSAKDAEIETLTKESAEKDAEIARLEAENEALIAETALSAGTTGGEEADDGSDDDSTGQTTPHGIAILCTGSMSAAIDQNFTLSGVCGIRETLSQRYHVLLADAGNAISGGAIGLATNGIAVVEAMNSVGYDVAVPGKGDFAFGMMGLKSAVTSAQFDWLSCNFTVKGKKVLDGYRMYEYDGVKVAIVGVTDPATAAEAPVGTKYKCAFAESDKTGKTFFRTVQQSIDAALADGAAYVIVITNLENERTDTVWTVKNLVAGTTGVNAVMNGNGATMGIDIYTNASGEEIEVVSMGSDLEGIGWVTLVDGSVKCEVCSWNSGSTATYADMLDNAGTRAVTTALASAETGLNTVIATTPYTLTFSDPADGVRLIRRGETNLGDIVADACRSVTGADIALIGGGAIRAELSGDITVSDVVACLPTGDAISVVKLNGREVLNVLEWGARYATDECGTFMQVSGLKYEVAAYLPSAVVEDANGNFLGFDGEYRVRNVTVNGKALDPYTTYTVAVPSSLARGDMGYTLSDSLVTVMDGYMAQDQALLEYLKNTLAGAVPETYASAYGDGRITVVKDNGAAEETATVAEDDDGKQ